MKGTGELLARTYSERTCAPAEHDWIDTFIQHAIREGQPFSNEDLELFFSKNALRFTALNLDSNNP